MAELNIKPEYELYADVVIEQFHTERIFLSPYSEMLLRLCIEAWFEEPPHTKDFQSWMPKKTLAVQVEDRHELLGILLARIFDEVSREPQIELNRERNQTVSFASLMQGIADCGHDVLEGWVRKN